MFISNKDDQNNIKALDEIIKTVLSDLKLSKNKPVIKAIISFHPTPLGTMCFIADDHTLYLLEFVDRKNIETEFKTLLNKQNMILSLGDNPITMQAKTELDEYFSGKRKAFTVSTKMFGTEFQVKVWESLLKIPYGHTASYAEQAILLNNDKAVRAVANANGMNRMAIIYPCHRIVGSNGSLTGYAGKVERKAWLLNHEKAAGFITN